MWSSHRSNGEPNEDKTIGQFLIYYGGGAETLQTALLDVPMRHKPVGFHHGLMDLCMWVNVV